MAQKRFIDRGNWRVLAGIFILSLASDPTRASNCNGTSVGLIPITDLGAGLYHGVEGGLYPGGTNLRPLWHDADLDRTGRLQLLNAQGNPDPNGRFVLLSIGMSNATQEFSTFKAHADVDPQKNSRLVIVDGAQGGQTAALISDPNAAFWTTVDLRLASAGVTPLQVQSIWLKEADANPNSAWPGYPNQLLGELRQIVQILTVRYPRTKSAYLSSRTYAGYASSTLNPEPYAFDQGFAVKWLIEDQLNGASTLNFDPARGPVMASWLSWAPYLWADGLTPRGDGLTWQCQDFVTNDGTHPSASGREKVASMLLGFFKSDPTTLPWFVDCDPTAPAFAAPLEVRTLEIPPAPSPGPALLSWEDLALSVGAGTTYDVVTGDLAELAVDSGFTRARCLLSGVSTPGAADPSPDPLPGHGSYYLARGRNVCGVGSYGESGLGVDPRDLLDAASQGCP